MTRKHDQEPSPVGYGPRTFLNKATQHDPRNATLASSQIIGYPKPKQKRQRASGEFSFFNN